MKSYMESRFVILQFYFQNEQLLLTDLTGGTYDMGFDDNDVWLKAWRELKTNQSKTNMTLSGSQQYRQLLFHVSHMAGKPVLKTFSQNSTYNFSFQSNFSRSSILEWSKCSGLIS